VRFISFQEKRTCAGHATKWVLPLLLLFLATLVSCGGGGGGGNSQSPPSVITLDASSVTEDGASLNGTVNPNGFDTDAWFEWGTDPALANPSTTPVQALDNATTGQPVSADLSGLSFGTTYYFRAVASNIDGLSRGAIRNFRTADPPPSATTLGAGTILEDSAVLNGTVNPNGVDTSAWFEWGTDPGLAVSDNTAVQFLGNGIAPQAVNAPLTGLDPGTTYYFRVNAGSAAGNSSGAILSFSTLPPPTATTQAATSITATAALLNGTVNPNGVSTDAWFEWGTDPTLATFTTTAVQPLGSGTTAQGVSAPLTTLSPGTTYYFRVRASSAAGNSSGSIFSFRTLFPPTVATQGATTITASTALLNGTVNPNGFATDAWFEWGTDPNLAVFASTTVQSLGSGTTPQAVSAPLATLSPGTTYYFRVKGSSAEGESTGSILSFLTLLLPSVSTQNVTSITLVNNDTQGQATFHGSVNPNGSSADAWFEWGTDPSLVSFTETTHQPVGSGTLSQPITATATTLDPWSTYYFRAAASSVAGGPVKGVIRSFPTGEYYVAVGDSITLGSGDNFPGDDTSLDGRNTGGGYEPVLNDLLTASLGYPHTVVNEGVSGDTSADGAIRISTTLSNHLEADYILVMYGTNDAFIPPLDSGLGLVPGDPGYNGSYKDNMQTIISAIVAAGKTPYLAKVPFTSDPLRSDASIQEYNMVIDELFFDNGIAVIPPDFYTYFQSNPGELAADGIHPNGTGYQSMAQLWFTSLTTP